MLQALFVPGAVAVLLVGCGQPGAPATVAAPTVPAPVAGDTSVGPAPEAVPPISDVRRTVEELFALAADAPVTVLDVTERSGLLRLLIQIGVDEPRNQVVWASRDGQYVADGLVEVDARREQLLADRRFATCLLEQGVRVFVNPNDGAGAAQLAQLGAFARRLAVDCTVGPGNCDALGIKELPTFAVGDSRSPGLRTRGWIESRTGCK